MQLSTVKFTGHPAYEERGEFELTINKITAIIGPNSSGKSTLLEMLNELFLFLAGREFNGKRTLPSHWRYTTATVRFKNATPVKLPSLAERVGGETDFLEIEVSSENEELRISKILTNNGSIALGDGSPYCQNPEVQNIEADISSKTARKQQFETERAGIKRSTNPSHLRRRNEIDKNVASLNEEIRTLNSQVPDLKVEILNFIDSETKQETPIGRKELKMFLNGADLPAFKYIPFGSTAITTPDNLVKKVLESKIGRDVSLHTKSVDELKTLLESDVHFWGSIGGDDLRIAINGKEFNQLSHGAQVCLLYYSFVFDTTPNSLVVWDEPENGLHHSRRYKLLQLLLDDKRQFIIATHSPELCPIVDKKVSVYQCTSKYDSIADDIKLDLKLVSGRESAFRIVEALGINPSITLFTSHVVIWVEGPSDIAFWRFFLKHKDVEKKLVEGFDYTFMFYGGANIANVDIADNEDLFPGADLLSLSRHPVIIIDADIDDYPPLGSAFSDDLKPGPAKVKQQVEGLNKTREDAARFFVIEAREIENYLPDKSVRHALWKLSEVDESIGKEIEIDSFKLGRFERYKDSIKSYFKAKSKSEIYKLPGISQWGRKSQFMISALSCPDLAISDLEEHVKKQLDDLYTWITEKKENISAG